MIILKILIILFGCLILSMIVSIIKNRRSLKVTNYVITDNKIPEKFNDYKIVHLSDLHTNEFGKDNEILVEKINKENPDIIVMTGDMLDCLSKKSDVLYTLSKQLVKKYKVYYIVGNHEQRYRNHKVEVIKETLKKIGVNVLDNEKLVLKKGKDKINLYGLVLKLKYYYSKKERKKDNINFTLTGMNRILGKANREEYNLLLVHTPIYYDTYASWGANLILSGHMHGGIMYIPKVGGLLSPERVFFPKYSGGKYVKENIDGKKFTSNLIVSKGLGFGRIPYRIYNPPEMIVIKLESKVMNNK